MFATRFILQLGTVPDHCTSAIGGCDFDVEPTPLEGTPCHGRKAVGRVERMFFLLQDDDIGMMTWRQPSFAITEQEMVSRSVTEHFDRHPGTDPWSSQPVQNAGNRVSRPGPPEVFLKMFGFSFRSRPQLT